MTLAPHLGPLIVSANFIPIHPKLAYARSQSERRFPLGEEGEGLQIQEESRPSGTRNQSESSP